MVTRYFDLHGVVHRQEGNDLFQLLCRLLPVKGGKKKALEFYHLQ